MRENMSSINIINNYIKKFMENQDCDDNLIQSWFDEKNQKSFNGLIPKSSGTKRAKSAYTFFCQEKRAELKENSELSSSEITKKLGEMWKKLKDDDPEEYQKYQDFALEEKEKLGLNKNTGVKKPKSAYLHFCQKVRQQVKEKNPEMKTTDITRELGKLWKELKENDKEQLAEYEKLAAQEKEEYNALPDDEKVAPKKRGTSAYVFFCRAKRNELKEENPDCDSKEITKMLSKMWKELKENDKEQLAEYEQLAAENKEQMKNDPEEKKPKRARTAYMLFCQAVRSDVKEENPDSDSKEITKILSQMWKELKENDQEKLAEYEQLAAEEKERQGEVQPKKKKESKKSTQPKKKKEQEEEKEVEKQTVKKSVTNITAYSNFKKQKTEEIKKKNPTLPTIQLAKMISEMWKNLSEEEQEEYM